MFSKSCQYGLQGVVYIAVKNDAKIKHVSLKDIAADQEIPYHFLSKILQKLVKNNILNSTKGANGGFSLKKSPNELKLIEVVEIIDGGKIFDRCVFGLKECSDVHPCILHHKYKPIKADIKATLSEKTISDLLKDVKDGHSIINFTHIMEQKA